MIHRNLVTSVETINGILTETAELRTEVDQLKAELSEHKAALAELQDRLDQYWDLHENVDYRSLVDQIREEARTVGEVLRGLDLSARKRLARVGPAAIPDSDNGPTSTRRLLPSVHSLLRTLDKWK